MKVFLSWSGLTSRAVAEALADWLPKVVQGVEPFVSAKDIDKGSNWTVELARELEEAEFGIVCLAPDNLLSPWLHYEAGAITKSVDSRVCPILFGLQKQDIGSPMSQLQLTLIEPDEFVLLISSINKAAGGPLTAPAVREAVEVWWPRLEAELSKIDVPKAAAKGASKSTPEPEKPVPEVTEMFEELLGHMRSLDSRVSRLEPRRGGTAGPARKGALSNAIRYLDRKLSTNDLVGIVTQISPEHIEVRIGGEGEIPESFAESVAVVSRAEDIEVTVRTHGRTARWLEGKRRDE